MDWTASRDKVVSVAASDTLNHAFQLMFAQVLNAVSGPGWGSGGGH